ncbi:hypothetical protein AZH53_08665 [Methanomicrobiaceae archaeon CYW5]|uniref:ADP-ribosylglycohydrolase family protein n=1 Tax=Methanovulcanius yangii TaxID=1789227 RepID=UPI0029C9DEC3|nr:ADP-ribosylglycohydrolase family protein [Methanovulcanius yangii]MBT8508476.1 hypothetical protein [Methanovulcanius yangii]
MISRYRGCMLGAAAGDALGMPGETMPPRPDRVTVEYRAAHRHHPNAGLSPGSYTDDTQLMLLAGELLADKTFTPERYAAKLAALDEDEGFRFPDGPVLTACRRYAAQGPGKTGVESPGAGCMPLAVPFALAIGEPDRLYEELTAACAVTHTHIAAQAGAVSFAMLLRATLAGNGDPVHVAELCARSMDPLLSSRIATARDLSREGFSLEAVLPVIGNDISVYQTLPMTVYLISRYGDSDLLLPLAAHIGGNSDTIAFLCGAWLGARWGTGAFSPALLDNLEDNERIAAVAEGLLAVGGKD